MASVGNQQVKPKAGSALSPRLGSGGCAERWRSGPGRSPDPRCQDLSGGHVTENCVLGREHPSCLPDRITREVTDKAQ